MTTKDQAANRASAVSGGLIGGGKHLIFRLADEEYGLDILKVKEIIGMMGITSVPQTPDYVKGVINLRGKVIPVIDLRLKFGLPSKEYDERTCIVVMDVRRRDASVQMGIVVDSVSEVQNISSESIEPTPSFGTALDTRFIRGIAKAESSVNILLDIDRILTGEELETLGAVA
jgi:purine-binding chemotaxis protein CheW